MITFSLNIPISGENLAKFLAKNGFSAPANGLTIRTKDGKKFPLTQALRKLLINHIEGA